MKKLNNSYNGRKKLDFLIGVALFLSFLALSPAAASVNNMQFSYYLIIGVIILLGLVYMSVIRGENKFIVNSLKALYSSKIGKMKGTEKAVKGNIIQPDAAQEKEETTTKQHRRYIAVPVLCIAIAELMIFFGRIAVAIWIHIGLLLAFTLSNIIIKDARIHKIYMSLMLLPVLRLVNLSMPVFFENALYSFIFTYSPLVIPAAVIIIRQRSSLEEMGITKKYLLTYLSLAVPLSFLLGLGEYLIIRPRFLIPDLTLENLLKLTIIMVFFVGLIEELIFRSIIQVRLEKILSVPEALLITSFLFGLMHIGYGTFYEMIYTSFVGLVIGFIFYKTKSLPFVSVLHGLINVFLFGILPFHLIGWTWI